MHKINIEKATLENTYYRKVLHTTPQMQLVLMSLNQGEDIPLETHSSTTQFIRVEKGTALAMVGKKRMLLDDGDSLIIPPGKKHYISQIGEKPLKLYTIYSPPEHPKNRVNMRQPLN